jgi:hypothetical protein
MHKARMTLQNKHVSEMHKESMTVIKNHESGRIKRV